MLVVVQVTVQVLILLLAQTETPTTGGLETIFDQKVFGLDPTTVFIISVSWSLFSCVRTQVNMIVMEKGFGNVMARLAIFAWSTFSTLRRILSLIAMFIPGLGLFSILHHWRWDQVPFSVRLEYAKKGFLTPEDKIGLYGLNETIYWTELDHWDYSDPQEPVPPHYSVYTLFSLPEIFIAGAVLLALQFVFIAGTKILTSAEFRHCAAAADILMRALSESSRYRGQPSIS